MIVAKRFRLEQELGRGGMGTVWQAMHEVTGERFALKFMRPERGSLDKSAVKRFRREARAPGVARHRNIAKVHDIIDLEDGLPMLVMELLEGETLRQKLAREKRLPLPEVAQILCPVLSAVKAIHSADIVHRDLKPDNIFLSVTPQGDVVPKVFDFGVAQLDSCHRLAGDEASLTSASEMLGTPRYWAWEQVSGDTRIDHRADIWAMGCVIYECLAGCRPISGKDFPQIFKALSESSIVPLNQRASELPPEIHDLVARMLTKKREQRLQDLREAIGILERYQPFSPLPPRRGVHHARNWVILAAACVAAATAATSAVYFGRQPASVAAPPASSATSLPSALKPAPGRFDGGASELPTGNLRMASQGGTGTEGRAGGPQPAPTATGKRRADGRQGSAHKVKPSSVPPKTDSASPTPDVDSESYSAKADGGGPGLPENPFK